jgi:serine/threonine protein phosphatase PrpC
MQCPACDTELPAENRFCEECGAPLPNAEAVPAPETSEDGCPRCGAPGESIDTEGYCAQCGFRRGRASRNHFEITVSPHFAGVCDRGLRHSRNEDFFCLGGAYVMVVCDGVSSSRRAEEASQVAAECACQALLAGAGVAEAIRQSQAAVLEINLADTGGHEDDPATTMVLARVDGSHASIGWVGDSRAYWISPGDNRQLTRDHSWVNEMAPSDVKPNSAQMHAITRWLGHGAPEEEPCVIDFEIPGPGALLLCTDGLWNYAPETDSLAALVIDGEAIEVARELVNFARAQGGVDNITAVLLQFPEGGAGGFACPEAPISQ